MIEPCIVTCSDCGVAMDVTALPPYTNAVCPSCGAKVRIKTLMGNYRLTGKLGIGGMSNVFRAMDVVLQREVAVKVLNERYSQDDVRCARFEKEAQIMASVSHENLVKIYSVGQAYGAFYIAMELVEGAGLDVLISKEGKIREEEVLRLVYEVTNGLAAAWDAGVMHRDIKPANILQDRNGTAKILDFGLSLLKDEVSQEKEIWVTPYYAAPETLSRAPEDFRTDMYALGATMLHMLTGALPLPESPKDTNKLLEIKSKLLPGEMLKQEISPATCNIVARLMQFVPEGRFASYEELKAAVTEAQETCHLAVDAGFEGWREYQKDLMERRFRKRLLLSIATGLAVGGGIVGAMNLPSGNPPEEKLTTGVSEPPHRVEPQAESQQERSHRLGAMYNEALSYLEKGEMVNAEEAFRQLSHESPCPLSLKLRSALNHVLCLWLNKGRVEGDSRLDEIGKIIDGSRDREELKRALPFVSSLKCLAGKSGAKEPGAPIPVEYLVGCALHCWHSDKTWRNFRKYYQQLEAISADNVHSDRTRVAALWLVILAPYHEGYERLNAIDSLPKHSEKQVVEKQSALARLEGDIKAGHIKIPSAVALLMTESIKAELVIEKEAAKRNDAKEAEKKKQDRAAENERREREAQKLEAEKAALLNRSLSEVRIPIAQRFTQTGSLRTAIEEYQKEVPKVTLKVGRAIEARICMLELLDSCLATMEKALPKVLAKKSCEISLKTGEKGRLLRLNGHLLHMKDGRGESDIPWTALSLSSFRGLLTDCQKANPALYKSKKTDYLTPLLVFAFLYGDMTEEQENKVLEHINDVAFTIKWHEWKKLMAGEEL